MYLPPPYVPAEYRNCKYSEMPEPYKSEIEVWIKQTTMHYESRLKAAKSDLFFVLAITLFVVALAVLFVK